MTEAVTESVRRQPKSQIHPRTIADELYKEWRKLWRKGDSKKLAKLLNVSGPTINKAIIYGHVQNSDLIPGINQFFTDRLNSEKEEAEKLRNLQNSINGTTEQSTDSRHPGSSEPGNID